MKRGRLGRGGAVIEIVEGLVELGHGEWGEGETALGHLVELEFEFSELDLTEEGGLEEVASVGEEVC